MVELVATPTRGFPSYCSKDLLEKLGKLTLNQEQIVQHVYIVKFSDMMLSRDPKRTKRAFFDKMFKIDNEIAEDISLTSLEGIGPALLSAYNDLRLVKVSFLADLECMIEIAARVANEPGKIARVLGELKHEANLVGSSFIPEKIAKQRLKSWGFLTEKGSLSAIRRKMRSLKEEGVLDQFEYAKFSDDCLSNLAARLAEKPVSILVRSGRVCVSPGIRPDEWAADMELCICKIENRQVDFTVLFEISRNPKRELGKPFSHISADEYHTTESESMHDLEIVVKKLMEVTPGLLDDVESKLGE
jgi:adenylate kinase